MNTYASKNNYTLHKNPGAEKRNTYQALPKRLYKNFETNRRTNRGSIISGNKTSGSAVDSIVQLFRGTIVTGETGSIEWKAIELFPSPFN
jgi:hypothetical protein